MIVVGIDEAGVGSWAGPLVVVSVALDEEAELPDLVRDSKHLSENQRESLLDEIYAQAVRIVVERASSSFIDHVGGVWAAWDLLTQRVMAANDDLSAERVVVDGQRPIPGYSGVKAEPRADDKYPEVSAASIVAKCSQTCIMDELDDLFPQYGFASHRGYGTPVHREALKKYGSTSHHRRTCRPVADHSFQALGNPRIIEKGEIIQ